MAILAVILGILGGLCAAMGIVTAAELIPVLMAGFTWMFWFVLSAILLLATIACLQARGGYD